MFFRCQEWLDGFQNWVKIPEIRARKLTLHLINVAKIKAQQSDQTAVFLAGWQKYPILQKSLGISRKRWPSHSNGFSN